MAVKSWVVSTIFYSCSLIFSNYCSWVRHRWSSWGWVEGRDSTENAAEEGGLLLHTTRQYLQASMQNSHHSVLTVTSSPLRLAAFTYVRMSALTNRTPPSLSLSLFLIICRLENHSTTVSCTLFWAIVRPLTTAPSLKSNISPVKGKCEYSTVCLDVMRWERIKRKTRRKAWQRHVGNEWRDQSYPTLSNAISHHPVLQARKLNDLWKCYRQSTNATHLLVFIYSLYPDATLVARSRQSTRR